MMKETETAGVHIGSQRDLAAPVPPAITSCQADQSYMCFGVCTTFIGPNIPECPGFGAGILAVI